MKCACCGEEVPDLLMEPAFGLPDDVFRMSEEERESRAIYNSDLCAVDDERFYIRGTIPLIVPGMNPSFNIGAWFQVDEQVFLAYAKDKDLSQEEIEGTLANSVPIYPPGTLTGKVAFKNDDSRPTMTLKTADHPLVHAQQNGMSPEDWHKLMAPIIAMEEAKSGQRPRPH